MLYLLAKAQDRAQSDAEEQRVLYVALTRAQQKLIISGHATLTQKSGWKTDSWLGELGEAAQVDINQVIDQSGSEIMCQTTTGQPVRAWGAAQEKSIPENAEVPEHKPVSEPGGLPIYAPLAKPAASLVAEDEAPEERDWLRPGRLPPSHRV